MTTAPLSPPNEIDRDLETTSRAAVSQQLLMLEKTLRATQLYHENNPMYQAALERLAASFRAFWRDEVELVLTITGNGFEWHGTRFDHDPEHPDGLSWLLYRDGLRSLTLSPGCEDEELIRFVTVVNKARHFSKTRQTGGDDLLTLLWPQEFAHVHYEFVEPQQNDFAPLETVGPLFNLGAPEDVLARIEDDIQQAGDSDEPSGIVKLDDSVATLHYLDEKEIDRLRREIDDEYRTELNTHVVAILFDIFETQTFSSPQDEIVTLIEDLIPRFLVSREYGVVAYILREARDIASRGSSSSEATKRLEDIPARISSPEVLNELLRVLDESPHPPPRDDLSELLGQLRPQAIGTILDWIPRLQNSTVKGALSLALDPIAKTNPKHLIYNMSSLAPPAIIAALEIIERLALRAVADDVAKYITHEDSGVRQAAAVALASLGTPTSMMALTQLVDDTNRDVRLTAVERLGVAKFLAAGPAIEAAMQSKLRNTPLSEKRVYYKSFAEISGESGVKRLDQQLNTKRLLRRRDDPDTRACAAMALGMIGSATARNALQRALQDKEPIVRNAAEQALRETHTG